MHFQEKDAFPIDLICILCMLGYCKDIKSQLIKNTPYNTPNNIAVGGYIFTHGPKTAVLHIQIYVTSDGHYLSLFSPTIIDKNHELSLLKITYM